MERKILTRYPGGGSELSDQDAGFRTYASRLSDSTVVALKLLVFGLISSAALNLVSLPMNSEAGRAGTVCPASVSITLLYQYTRCRIGFEALAGPGPPSRGSRHWSWGVCPLM